MSGKRFLYVEMGIGQVMDSAFAGTVEQYNQLVDEEMNVIQEALDEIADDCDNLDYDIAVLHIALIHDDLEWSAFHQHGIERQLCDQQTEPK